MATTEEMRPVQVCVVVAHTGVLCRWPSSLPTECSAYALSNVDEYLHDIRRALVTRCRYPTDTLISVILG